MVADIKIAQNLTSEVCAKHGQATIEMIGRDGLSFGVAYLGAQEVMGLIENLSVGLEAYLDKDDG